MHILNDLHFRQPCAWVVCTVARAMYAVEQPCWSHAWRLRMR